MNIYIDLNECKNDAGKVLAAIANVSITNDIDEGYDVKELHKLKASLQEVLDKQLSHCIEKRPTYNFLNHG